VTPAERDEVMEAVARYGTACKMAAMDNSPTGKVMWERAERMALLRVAHLLDARVSNPKEAA
jgi:hypothetical protein